MTGKRLNGGAGLGLEILVNVLYGDPEVTTWLKNSLEKLDNELLIKVKKCVKEKHACVFYFPNQSCPLLRGKFCPNVDAVLKKIVLFKKSPL